MSRCCRDYKKSSFIVPHNLYFHEINIKKQVSSIYEDHYDESQSKKAGEYSTEMIEDIDEYYRLNMNQYSSNLYSREIQLKNQI